MPTMRTDPNKTTADNRLSRRERRHGVEQRMPFAGKVNTRGRDAVVTRKHINYRRG
ncbi:hypothetical protein [Nocardia arthritidis]|uniref:Uncharacterized protein n=1 Tax=Nocardia arthritidis TaxID=228602 RepID=A0A6G9Y976_9NOCA|nr:hypothetical protein [Nocardia arthritidis]QIS09728.1 hypothetical protein F5544_09135 [Nocardia arthritidis]